MNNQRFQVVLSALQKLVDETDENSNLSTTQSELLNDIHGLRKCQNPAQSLTFAFRSNKEKRGNDVISVLRSILFQLLSTDKKAIRYLDEGFVTSSFRQSSLVELTAALSKGFTRSHNSQFWMIIDGLDEMPKQGGEALVYQLCDLIDNDLVGRLRVLVTGRRGPADPRIMGASYLSSIYLDTGEVYNDVKAYISNLVDEFCTKNNFPNHLLEAVQSEVISRSNSLFLLATLNLAAFTQGVTYWNKRTALTRLADLKNTPSTFQGLYCDLLCKVPEHLRPLLRKLFMWVLVARQPLTIDELHHAVSVDSDHSSYQELRGDLGFNSTQVLRNVLHQFVKISALDEVQFRHQSFKDLLLERPKSLIIKLGWQQFPDNSPKSNFEAEFEGYCRPYLLVLYCLKHWPSHFQNVDDEDEMVERARDSLLSTNRRGYSFLYATYHLETRRIKPEVYPELTFTNPLHAAIQFGDFPNLVKSIAMSGEDINQLDPQYMTPLHWAIIRGRKNVFEFLIRHPKINPNRGEERFDKPIHICVNSLFQRKTALHKIMEQPGQFEPLLDLLLKRKDLFLNQVDDEGTAPFIRALISTSGESASLKLLHYPSRTLDVKVSDTHGTNALSLASLSPSSIDPLSLAKTLPILRLLLDHGFPAQNSKALCNAVKRRNVSCAKCLIEHGADVNGRDENDRTALTVAVSIGCKEMISLLLDAKADIHARNACTWFGSFMALDLAYRENRRDIVELLKAAEKKDFKKAVAN
ncbi:hypothetical protein AJ80_01446 [Polytolypa hystricis UAMH7299]|uniref:Uncharacterized protein n=1 Tax=Polytolypa hystricis (strain UAMH7299) TaxID=1447883 RepID=A0A2B7YS59_POLH7|nr:hypothetical protein AJ80_01446 [Polytolypa hystricis UAMH7299]